MCDASPVTYIDCVTPMTTTPIHVHSVSSVATTQSLIDMFPDITCAILFPVVSSGAVENFSVVSLCLGTARDCRVYDENGVVEKH